MRITKARAGEGKPSLFAAIERTSRFAVARLCEEATRRTSAQVLKEVPIVVPCKLHAILTDRAIEGATGPSPMARGIPFGPSSPATAAPSSRVRAAST